MGSGFLPFKGCLFAKKLANLVNLTNPLESKQASILEKEKEAASTLWAGHRPWMLNTNSSSWEPVLPRIYTHTLPFAALMSELLTNAFATKKVLLERNRTACGRRFEVQDLSEAQELT